MNFESFVDRCNELWPGKELSREQLVIYREKLSQYEFREVGKIYEWLRDNAKFFPKIADIVEAAKHCGFSDRVQAYEPHRWHATECRLCGGSGKLGVFFEILTNRETGGILRNLKRVMQYEASEPTNRLNQDWTRFVFRCDCPAGDAKTLEMGIPKWKTA